MDASSNTPPQQTERATQNHRHIPPEVMEEVLLNLPVKSLLQFSSVSKSWNSMIFEDGFIKRYRLCAALPGRERVFRHKYSNRPLISDFLSDRPINWIEDVRDHVDPVLGTDIVAWCDELWCFRKKGIHNPLFIWNPSMRTYRELPPPQFSCGIYGFDYGLGYDSVGDDYKLVTINKRRRYEKNMEAMMYSLRSDSWKEIQPFPVEFAVQLISYKGWFVDGALHWLVRVRAKGYSIISFNLSTETYGELMVPAAVANDINPRWFQLDVVRGKLCLLETMATRRLSLWVMEDYGVVESWKEEFCIDCNYVIKPQQFHWRPLYVGDNGEIVIRMFHEWIDGIYVSENDRALGWKKLFDHSCMATYVEGLVSPATWPYVRQVKPS